MSFGGRNDRTADVLSLLLLLLLLSFIEFVSCPQNNEHYKNRLKLSMPIFFCSPTRSNRTNSSHVCISDAVFHVARWHGSTTRTCVVLVTVATANRGYTSSAAATWRRISHVHLCCVSHCMIRTYEVSFVPTHRSDVRQDDTAVLCRILRTSWPYDSHA